MNKKYQLITTISLSSKEFRLLKKLDKEGYAEYRDYKFDTYEKYFKAQSGGYYCRDEESFKKRNFGGTKFIMDKLFGLGLVDMEEMAWNITFKITELGKKFIKENL